MNRRNTLLTIFTALVLVLSSCEKENENPRVEILSPEDETIVMQGDVVPFEMDVEDEDGAVTSLILYIRGIAVDTFTAYPLVYDWHTDTVEAGGHTVYAKVTDDEDASTSDIITVIVNIPGGLNPDLAYGTMTDYNGNAYPTIEIGEQTWMAENLKVTHFADGTPINEVAGDENWAQLNDEAAYCWYDDHAAYADTFGALYNHAAVVDERGLCPAGWHVPSDEEWMQLEMSLGMSEASSGLHDWRGSNEGGQLKEVGYTHWEVYNDSASNASGFTALPGGFRSHRGSFNGAAIYATFWTSTINPDNGNAWYRILNYERGGIYRHNNIRNQAYSIRCVKD